MLHFLLNTMFINTIYDNIIECNTIIYIYFFYFTAGGIRTLTHHVNVAHVTREPEQQNNGYLPRLLPIIL